MQIESELLSAPCWKVGSATIAYKETTKSMIMHFLTYF